MLLHAWPMTAVCSRGAKAELALGFSVDLLTITVKAAL